MYGLEGGGLEDVYFLVMMMHHDDYEGESRTALYDFGKGSESTEAIAPQITEQSPKQSLIMSYVPALFIKTLPRAPQRPLLSVCMFMKMM